MSVKRHTAYNLIGAILPILLTLATIPFYLSAIGEARYGVLALAWLLTGHFGFFDFGLGRAMAFAIARSDDTVQDEKAKLFWTAFGINLALGAVGGTIILILASILFFNVFNTPPDLVEELRGGLPWLALGVPLLTLQGVMSGILMGLQRFLQLNIRATIGTALTQLLPLAAVWIIAPTLEVAIPATILARLLSVALLFGIAFKAIGSPYRPRFGGKPMVRELLGYGGWISLNSVLGPIITSLDRFLIASFLNPTAVALYSVPFDLVTRGAVFSRALSDALFPSLAQKTPEEARELAWRGIKANAGLMLVLCILGMLIMEPFLTLWIDADFARQASIVGELIAISLWFNALALMPFNLLQAQGRPSETTAILFLQVVPFMIIALPGVYLAGIVGAVLARNVRSAVDVAMLAHRAGLLTRTAKLVVVPLLLFALNLAAIHYFGALSLVGSALGLCLLSIATVWALWISPEIRDLFFKFSLKARGA